ncbi:MAG: DciA family protein [Pseudomonadota bacterium]
MPEPASSRTKPRRGGGLRALAVSLPKVTAKAFGRRGLAEAGLVADWPAIVGQELSGVLLPRGLSYARRAERRDGTLTLRVAPGFGPAVQHLEPLLIERVNGYLGYPAVGRLRLQQGPVARRRSAPRKTPEPPPEAAAALARRLDDVADSELAAALERLGRALLTSEQQSKEK